MKRYIKSSNIDEYKSRLRKWGFTDEDLSQFTDEKITEIAKSSEEPELSPDVERQIYEEFSPEDAEEICALIECGYSVDSAIQTVIYER